MNKNSKKGNNERPEISLSDLEEKTLGDNRRADKGLTNEQDEALDPNSIVRDLKLGFIATLLTGSFFIFAFKNYGLLNIILCTFIMCIYWAFANSRIKIHSAKAVFADSFYYLGFLFTFIALISTMIGLDSINFKPEVIVGQIGPALATTVLGMAVRIYITQFNAITSEPETEVIHGIGELSYTLSSTLNELQALIAEFSKASKKQQKINFEIIENFSKQTEKLNFEPLFSAVNNLTAEINSLFVTSEVLKKAGQQAETGVAELTSSIFRATTQIDRTNNDFSRYRSINEDFKSTKDSLISLKSDTDLLRKTIENAQEIDFLNALSNIDSEAISLHQSLDKTDSKVNRLSEIAEEAKTKLENSITEVDEAEKVLDGFRLRFSELDELVLNLSSANKQIKKFKTDIEKINDDITNEIYSLKSDLSGLPDKGMEQIKEEIKLVKIRIDQAIKDFNPIEKNIKDLDLRVKNSVTDVLNFLKN